jgi:hypothetical protein
MDSNKASQKQVFDRVKELREQDAGTLLAYLVALQERVLSRLDLLGSQLERIASQSNQQQFASDTQSPAMSKPIEYEYTSVTVRTGALLSEDKAVNSKISKMASQGWELVSNTEARGTVFSPRGRMLQFRRPK